MSRQLNDSNRAAVQNELKQVRAVLQRANCRREAEPALALHAISGSSNRFQTRQCGQPIGRTSSWRRTLLFCLDRLAALTFSWTLA